MDDWDGDDDRADVDEEPTPARPPGEGVRILGAEEAAAALQSGQAEGREPLRFPTRTAPEGVTPAASFPLEVDPGEVPRPTVAMPAAPPTLPHWTAPPTGEVPSVLSGRAADETDEDDLNAWSALSGGQPRWRDRHDAWDDSGYDDASVLADDQPPLGALDESRTSPFAFEDEPLDDDFGAFADGGAGAVVDPIPLRQPAPAPERRSRAPRVPRPRSGSLPGVTRNAPPEGRDIGTAVGIGVGFAVVALLAFKLGPFWAALLITGVVMLAAVELYDVLRRAGYQPATLLGLSATLAILVATYQEGEAALPLVTVLLVTFTFIWYLARVVTARPTVNAAATILAFMWTGFLGSFAMLMARPDPFDSRVGIAFLLGAVLATAFNDIGAYFVGSRMGSRPLAPEISPNKTWEGAIGGAVVSIVVTVLVLGFLPGMEPWDGGKAFWLALVVSIVAPLGDLAESMIKRDLGIKDMGRLLPGHGGVMDRFDALLFVLPAVYYLVQVLYT
ncbi:MAG TPA: phosphatidate cytidylyltransferase [Acidimicrobiales bacterium]|nr:phosphatidate cytidylyltransferase [Acidimicrobiales bacterium]